MEVAKDYVIGLDFGTDSMRAVLVSSENGSIKAETEFLYPRWKEQKYCNPAQDQFRQHPKDYIEGIEFCIRKVLNDAGNEIRKKVCAISVGTTGSTPVAVDEKGIPLALYPEFENNPNAMFFLWKDHTAQKEADEINKANESAQQDYLKYVGGIYSSEWFWAKFLHMARTDKQVKNACYTWVEHCDWVPFLLTGEDKAEYIKRSRCAAGHKALWAEEFGGLPDKQFFEEIDPVFKEHSGLFFGHTYTCDKAVGNISEEWSRKLGLSKEVIIGVGGIDAHFAAVGGGIQAYQLCKVMGTSTCDMLVVPKEDQSNIVNGICGQVDGSIVPEMIGMEAGQSAFGDIFNWYAEQLLWVFNKFNDSKEINRRALKGEILKTLEEEAKNIPLDETRLLATDWFNGRRTPDAKNHLKASLIGLDLGTQPAHIYKSLIEASCFGAKRIIERFQEEGVAIKSVMGVGGIVHKSPYIMQTLANILGLPIYVGESKQASALGAAIFAAVVAGQYPNLNTAITNMVPDNTHKYLPNKKLLSYYEKRYLNYKQLSELSEGFIELL